MAASGVEGQGSSVSQLGGGTAVLGSGKKGKGRGEVLTSVFEFQFAKKEAPAFDVCGAVFDLDHCRMAYKCAGRFICTTAISARKAAAQSCSCLEERVQGVVRAHTVTEHTSNMLRF
jgi:hypothetical protein